MFDAHTQAESLGQHGVVIVEEQRRESCADAGHQEVLRRGDELVVFGGITCRSYLLQVNGELLLGVHRVDFRAGEVIRGLRGLWGELEFAHLVHLGTIFAFHGDLFVVLG